MGNRTSRVSRRLPDVIHTIDSPTLRNGSRRLTEHKVDINHTNPSTIDDSPQETKRIIEGTDNPAIENVSKFGHIQSEEIPVKLDQNNAALKTLRNRKALDDVYAQSQNLTGNQARNMVDPSEFYSIVSNMNRYDPEQLMKNYKLSESFLNTLQASGIRIATTLDNSKSKSKTKVDPRTRKRSKTGLTQEEADFNRINGIRQPTNTRLEDTLESLMKPK